MTTAMTNLPDRPEVARRPYRMAARYYGARPPYSAELRPALASRLGWDGTGRLLDVGCGPGVVALQLAESFREIVGVDPEETMLAEARFATPGFVATKIRWVQGRAEDIPELDLGTFKAVTLAQSFHWTDKDAVAEIIYDALEPGGAILLIHHEPPGFGPGDEPTANIAAASSDHPGIPHDLINTVLVRWLGRGKPAPDPHREPYRGLLARTRLGAPERLILPGRTNLIRTVDNVIDNYLSTSFAAPDLFGDRLDEFRADLASELRSRTKTGSFWEWPGNTEVLLAVKGT